MATTSDKKTAITLLEDWDNLNPKARLRALEKLDSSDSEAQAELNRIAKNDEHIEVRCGAIMLLSDLGALKHLQKEESPVKDSALQQSYRILAGTIGSPLSEAQRLSQLKDLPTAAVKQIALISKCKKTATETIGMLSEAEDLRDLCLFASSVNVRKGAALKIEDIEILTEIREKVAGKDKTVFKVIDQRLNQAEKSPETKPEPAKKIKPEAGAESPKKDHLDTEQAKPAKERKKTEGNAAESKAAEIKETSKSPAKPKPPLDAEKELPALELEFPKLSYKNTIRLYEVRSTLNKLRHNAESLKPELLARIETLKTQVAEKLDKNIEYQEKTRQSTELLLESLKQALEDGKSESAMQAWDKIQGNISNTSNRIREVLQKQANEYKAKLTELRDWKTFASTEKKKELLTQMQHLIDSKMHAADRSKHISKMHQEWKSLGRSNQNELLWKKFKKLSDEAYEPCKEYFKQRKQLMIDNLNQRRKICDHLEAELKSLQADKEELPDHGAVQVDEKPLTADSPIEPESETPQESMDHGKSKPEADNKVNIATLNKLLSTAEKDWKRFAPIEQSKIKSLQKRFYATVNEIRKLRKASSSTNARQKQLCVAQAQALVELEDNKKAMNEAKQLQLQWKKIGPTSYKEDNKYWLEFRAACDQIFEKRNQVSNELKENLKKAEHNLAELLQSMESLFKLDDDSFRKARSEYQDLAQKFSNALDPRLKQQRGRLLDQFNALKRKIDSRFKTLPDKKQQQLKKIILEKVGFLTRIEDELLSAKDDSQFLERHNQLDSSAWKSIESSGNKKLESALEERMQSVAKAQSSDSIQKLAQKSESSLRSLCIQTEIRANIETPAQDQAQRMQIQLQQLKNGFGQSKPDPKENAKHAMEVELESYCFGPLGNECRQELNQRLQGAIKKLLQ